MTPHDLLDTEIAKAIEILPFADIDAAVLAVIREMDMQPGPVSDAVERTEHRAGDVPLRVHRPADNTDTLPCIYSIHGGGYVLGSNIMEDPRFDAMCPNLNCVAVSVEYRLAPDTPYPGPLEDCYTGLQWTVEHADELGIDPNRIGVMGVSAGGGLAASLALLTRDRGGPSLAFQFLDQPMLDDRQITTSSQTEGLPVWSRHSNAFGWKSYLGDLYGRDDIPYTAAPARATDLSGLPPAFISVGALDGFRDEDVDYALRLNNAGVPAELHVYPGACHGFNVLAPDAPVTKQQTRDMMTWLARQCAS